MRLENTTEMYRGYRIQYYRSIGCRGLCCSVIGPGDIYLGSFRGRYSKTCTHMAQERIDEVLDTKQDLEESGRAVGRLEKIC